MRNSGRDSLKALVIFIIGVCLLAVPLLNHADYPDDGPRFITISRAVSSVYDVLLVSYTVEDWLSPVKLNKNSPFVTRLSTQDNVFAYPQTRYASRLSSNRFSLHAHHFNLVIERPLHQACLFLDLPPPSA